MIQKINHAMHQLTQKADHLPPQTALDKLKQKYQSASPLLKLYLQMQRKNKQDYLPVQGLTNEIKNIFIKQKILMARFIFILEQFKMLDHFMIYFQNYEREVYQCYSRLPGKYKNRYLSDIGYLNRHNCQFKICEQFSLSNYKFYMQKIGKLHQKRGDYQYLQSRHDYIQLMFPNHFQSMFNSSANPMSYVEVSTFRQSRKLGLLLLKSIEIFFDFMGIQIKENYQLNIVSQHRLQQVLLYNWHNHLRIRRILACLSITGFRKIALKLIQFLGQVIKKRKNYSKLHRVFQNEWQIYGDQNKTQCLKKLCFHPYQDFPATHKVCLQIFNQSQQNVSYQKIQTNSQFIKNVKQNQNINEKQIQNQEKKTGQIVYEQSSQLQIYELKKEQKQLGQYQIKLKGGLLKNFYDEHDIQPQKLKQVSISFQEQVINILDINKLNQQNTQQKSNAKKQ